MDKEYISKADAVNTIKAYAKGLITNGVQNVDVIDATADICHAIEKIKPAEVTPTKHNRQEGETEMEIEVYGVHILQQNSNKNLFSDKLVKLIKKHNGAAVPRKSFLYAQSLAFPNKESQKAFVKDCRGFINVEVEVKPAYIDAKYKPEEW